MGELIRNLNQIRIGSAELMIELNEGYTEKDGLLIHVQNNHFRYLLNESDFLSLSATIMRAKSEMEYYKNRKYLEASNNKIQNRKPYVQNSTDIVYISDLLNESQIDYRFIEGRPSIITFIVNNEDYSKFRKVVDNTRELIRLNHIYSKEYGYTFLYQMRPFELYKKGDIYYEFLFQLPCMSLTSKTWIPLHRKIQMKLWSIQDVNCEHGYRLLDGFSLTIYRLCWSVFNKGYLSSYDIEIIENNIDSLNSLENYELLYEVFYKYTDELLKHINSKEYKIIIPDYYRFKNY